MRKNLVKGVRRVFLRQVIENAGKIKAIIYLRNQAASVKIAAVGVCLDPRQRRSRDRRNCFRTFAERNFGGYPSLF